jgi:hypothetical protein
VCLKLEEELDPPAKVRVTLDDRQSNRRRESPLDSERRAEITSRDAGIARSVLARAV